MTSLKNFVFAVLCVLLVARQTFAELDEDNLPENQAIFAGDLLILRCWVANAASGHRMQWTDYHTNPDGALMTDGDVVLPAHPMSSRIRLDRSNIRQFDLHVNLTTAADSGTYQCADANAPATVKRRHSAEVCVFAGPQSCTTTKPQPPNAMIESIYYTTECVINYGLSNIRPIMGWVGPPPFGQGQSITDTQGWNGMSVYAARHMHNDYFTSTVSFADIPGPLPPDVADNTPTFSHDYDTFRLIIHWPPGGMYTDPVRPLNEYQVGDAVTCNADAFPTASFEWHNTRTGERFVNYLFVIPVTWLGTSQVMRCVATNIINGLIFNTEHLQQVNVPAPTTPTEPPTSISTTPVPAVSSCLDLAGHWVSTSPSMAHMCVEVDWSANGNVHAVGRLEYDVFWFDFVGQTNLPTFDHMSFTAIWPLNRAVSTFIGECHRCYGDERLIVNAVTRSKGDGMCGQPGQITYTEQYEFVRSTGLRCPPITMP